MRRHLGASIRLLVPILPALLLLPIAAWVRYSADFGLAYEAGRIAWSNGNPQVLTTWTGTPFYAVLMAFITRVVSEDVGARLFLFATIALWAVLLVVTWDRLRSELPERWWWVSLLAAGVFAPAVSTIFWLQPNLWMLVFAVIGVTVAQKRSVLGGVLIGVSIAVKPILLLLPLILLVRRGYRTSGFTSLLTTGALSVLGLAYLAWRANDLARIDPIRYLAAFLSKGTGPMVACVPENYSPLALLCRLSVPTPFPVEAVIALAVVAGAVLLVRAMPPSIPESWGLLAIAGLLSPWIGPIDWAVYGILFGPLFLLLLREFSAESTPLRLWIGLGFAYLLLELAWDPLESLLLAPPVTVVIALYSIGQFGQYVLLLVLVRWLMLQTSPQTAEAKKDAPPRVSAQGSL